MSWLTPLLLWVTGMALAVAAIAVIVAGQAIAQRDRALAARDAAIDARRGWERRCRRTALGLAPAPVLALPAAPEPASIPVVKPEPAQVREPLVIPDWWPDPPAPNPNDDITAEVELVPDVHTHPPLPVIPVPPADRRPSQIGTST